MIYKALLITIVENVSGQCQHRAFSNQTALHGWPLVRFKIHWLGKQCLVGLGIYLDSFFPGWFSHWHGIRICACLLGFYFTKFDIVIGGFLSEMKEPKLHKLGVFWANYGKNHPIWARLDVIFSKMVLGAYWWVDNCAKNWYRES